MLSLQSKGCTVKWQIRRPAVFRREAPDGSVVKKWFFAGGL
jgi:hypothetical protein